MPILSRLPRLILGLLLTATAVSSIQAQLAATPGTQFWINSALNLRVAYSTAFDREPADRLAAIPGALFTTPQDCTTHLLTLGSNLDRDVQIVVKGQDPTLQPKGTLAVTEIKRTCFDPNALADDILRDAIAATAKIDGMRPLTRPTNDFILGTTVWFAAATGFNKDARGKRTATAGTTILGTAGALVNGHLVVWSVTANDPALFNKLLNISVCFDAACTTGSSNLVAFRLAEPRQIASR